MEQKYKKYKQLYFSLKNMIGGGIKILPKDDFKKDTIILLGDALGLSEGSKLEDYYNKIELGTMEISDNGKTRIHGLHEYNNSKKFTLINSYYKKDDNNWKLYDDIEEEPSLNKLIEDEESDEEEEELLEEPKKGSEEIPEKGSISLEPEKGLAEGEIEEWSEGELEDQPEKPQQKLIWKPKIK